jgi:DNA-binding transcriptional LysR family regulator
VALDRVFSDKQISVQYIAELDNIEMVKRLVEVGAGIAVIPEKSCRHEVQAGTLVQAELTDPGITRPIGIIHRTGKHFSPAAEKFIEYLQSDPARRPRKEREGGSKEERDAAGSAAS